MALNIKIVTPPVLEPLTLKLAKAQCGVDSSFTADDDLFNEVYIPAARQQAENVTHRAFFNQVWQRTLDDFPLAASFDYSPSPADKWNWPVYGGMWNRLAIDLPKGPALAINSIGYIDGEGNPQTLNSSLYQADLTGTPCRLVPSQGADSGMVWPWEGSYLPGSVSIQWTAASYVRLVTEGFTVPASPGPYTYSLQKKSVAGLLGVVNGSNAAVSSPSIAYGGAVESSVLTVPSSQAGLTLTVSYYVAQLPPNVLLAMLLLIGHFYRNREATTDLQMAELPMGVQSLLSSEVIEWTDYRPC